MLMVVVADRLNTKYPVVALLYLMVHQIVFFTIGGYSLSLRVWVMIG